MKVNTDKTLKKISELMDKLGQSAEFEEIHEETLNLCRIVYDRKFDYKDINIPYPAKIEIQLTDFSGKGNHKIIDGNPNRRDTLTKLREDTLSVLRKLHKHFILRKEIED